MGCARQQAGPALPPPLPAPSEVSNALVKDADAGYKPVVEADELEKILRPSRYDGEDPGREPRRGVVWGFVVTGMGAGAIIPVESIVTPGSGHLKLTGSLGEVRRELVHPYYHGLIHRVFFFRLSRRARSSCLARSRHTRMISRSRISVRWTGCGYRTL
jgi:hypothetical protein